jgi:hypothetical protein
MEKRKQKKMLESLVLVYNKAILGGYGYPPPDTREIPFTFPFFYNKNSTEHCPNSSVNTQITPSLEVNFQ